MVAITRLDFMNEQEPSTDLSELKQPCVSNYGRGDRNSLKVPYARCADGVARHISEVSGRHEGPFRCLDCKEQLSFRQYKNKRTHFAHRPDSRCSGETALHVYAKELLRRKKRISLPPLILRDEGITQTVFEGGTFNLDKVEIERSQGDFQPDALIHIGSVVRAIEFKVSHSVDDDKRAKVISQNMPMIEIDLDHLRHGNFEAETLNDEILESAPRIWIHHPDRSAGKKRLAVRANSKRKERGRRLKWHIEKKVDQPVPPGWVQQLQATVFDAGLQEHVGLKIDCSHWFTVNETLWQAAVFDILIIQPSVQFSPGTTLKIKGDWQSEHRLDSSLPDWLIRDDLSSYPLKRLEEAGFSAESFGSPNEAVKDYLWELSVRDQIVFWDKEWECFRIADQLHGRLHRRQEIRGKLHSLLESSKIEDAEVVTEIWMDSYNINGQSPEAITAMGAVAYDELMDRLSKISEMSHSYYGIKITEDLCGLPLEKLLEDRLREKALADDKREQERIAAIASRGHSLQLEANEGLEGEASSWLDSVVANQSVPISNWASESDETLSRARSLLYRAIRDKKQRERDKAAIEALQAKLTQAAYVAFPDKVYANLFLRSGHPKIDGKRPIEYCTNTSALNFLMSLMPRKRR